jgi:predicted permease
MNRFAKRLRALLRRKQLDRDLEDELSFHLAMKTEASGDPSTVRREFGNVSALKETCRELWVFTALERWWQDLRYAVRALAKSPTVTWVAVVALALGIGSNTTVFTVVSSALSFNMGVDHLERVVFITAGDGIRRNPFHQSFPAYQDFRPQVKSIENLTAYTMTLVNVSDSRALPERFACVQMTASGWAVVGRRPILGRGFTPGDERPGAKPTILLTHRLWQNRYGRDPEILGKQIVIDEVPRVVIGVMPPGIQFPEDTDLWMPLTPADAIRNAPIVMLFGRLAPGVTLKAARTEIDGIARRLVSQDQRRVQSPPEGGLIADVRPFLELIGIYDARALLIAVVFAVGFVLLIVCADVANLLLARANVRAREISIRLAIGAGRARIIRQLMIESILLAAAGGFFGWLVALAGLHWFDVLSANARRPSWISFSIDARAFVYLAAVSIGAGILFGLAPALQLAKIDLNHAIKDGGHGSEGGKWGRRLSSLLVVFQMALCVILLTGAGLMIHSSVNLYHAPMTIDPSNVLTMHISLPLAKYKSPADQAEFYSRLKTRLEALPGVRVASLASNLPFRGWINYPAEREGAPSDDLAHAEVLGALVVSADYFQTLEVQLERGRFFAPSDGMSGSPVAIVNESFAARLWPGEDALGKRVRRIGTPPRPWLTVVGVVPDIPQSFRQPLERAPLIYVPEEAAGGPVFSVLARTSVTPATLAQAFRGEVQTLDENLAAQDVSPLEDDIARMRLNTTMFGTLFTVFAAIALLLAWVGLYAVIAHAVSRRTQEIGIRMAMGAGRNDILAIILRQGMCQVVAGLAFGLPLAFALTRVLESALIGVSRTDPVTLASVVAVLLLAGGLGCAIPARRAIRVDPLVALRFE